MPMTIRDNFVMDDDSFHMIYIMPQAAGMNHIENFRTFSRGAVKDEDNCHCERILWSNHKGIYPVECLPPIKSYILKDKGF